MLSYSLNCSNIYVEWLLLLYYHGSHAVKLRKKIEKVSISEKSFAVFFSNYNLNNNINVNKPS